MRAPWSETGMHTGHTVRPAHMPIDINWLRPERGGDPEKWRGYLRMRYKDPALIDAIAAADLVRVVTLLRVKLRGWGSCCAVH